MTIKWQLAIFLTALIGLSGCTNREVATAQDMADRFLAALSEEDYEKASRHLVPELATKTPPEQLRQFATFTRLDRGGHPDWNETEVAGTKATLQGSIVPPDGADRVPLRLLMEKRNLTWKIGGIQRGIMVSSSTGKQALFVPSDEVTSKLAQTTTAAFAAAVKAKDLESFWKKTSAQFRKRFPKDAFERAFVGFVKNDIDIAPAARLEPVFTIKPTIGSDGVMTLAGHFPTKPSQTSFTYEYISEAADAWTLNGISLVVRPQ